MKSIEVDGKAWINNPRYNYVYNKLWLCKTQEIKAAPSGVEPDSYPVFYKPIINLYSLGAFSFKADGPVDGVIHSGLFWMEYLEGKHWTFDCYYNQESFHDVYALEAEKSDDNFDLWKIIEDPDLEYSKWWVKKHLKGYSGPLNIEIIGDNIIEVHLRNSEQLSLMKNRGKGYCSPVFGKDREYHIPIQKVKNQLSEHFKETEFILTLEDGKPEIGMGDKRRIGYLISTSKQEVLQAKKYFVDTFL